MIPDIVHEATYPQPPEAVWRAIAAPDALESWLMRNDLREAKAGERFRFRDRPRPFWDGVVECEVVAADAPRRFALRWGVGGKAAFFITFAKDCRDGLVGVQGARAATQQRGVA